MEEPGADESALDKTVRLTAVGEAGELLIKSTLAGINPALLADKTNMMTLLKLTDNDVRAAQGKMTTAGPIECLRRLNECRPTSSPKVTEPKLLFDVRNDVLHMGLAPTNGDLEAARTELVTLVAEIFDVRKALGQNGNWNQFWSDKHLKIVEARQRASHEQLVTQFKKLVAQARTAYQRLTDGLDQDARNRLVAELTTRIPSADDTQIVHPHRCPACHHTMWVIYDVQRDIEIDDSEMPSGGSAIPHGYAFYARLHGQVDSASCPVCGLSLDQSELILTTVPFTVDLGQEEATDEEEQAWKSARNAEYEMDYDDAWDDDDEPAREK